jgi:hypothetical protein
MPLRVSTESEPRVSIESQPIHGTSLTRSRVLELISQVDDFDLDKRSLEEQYIEIKQLITELETAGLTNEADSMKLISLQLGIEHPANARGKKPSMPSHFVNIITQILIDILPFAKNNGGKRRRTHRKTKTRKQRRGAKRI